jgi:hypothetical protein
MVFLLNNPITQERGEMQFNWHEDTILRLTPVDSAYRSTQNVRRFLVHQCGPDFKFDRALMAWIRDGRPKNMGEVADEWRRLHRGKQ